MRKVNLEIVQPGMVLARSVLGGAGQVLLKPGTEIKPQYITYLGKLGINDLYIKDKRIEDIEVNDVVSDQTRQEARSLVKNIFDNAEKTGLQRKGVNVERAIQNTVSKILDELMTNRDLIYQLVDVRAKGDYIFAHSVNCCILASIVAVKMRYNRESLKFLAIGALLHDIGMAVIPPRIVNKPGPLTADEFETIKSHPVFGYELFKKSNIFDARAGAVILQHHERHSGQGYPLGLSGKKINPLAQILGIVNVYDSLTSERPYRKAYYPHEAVEMLLCWGGDLFDMEILSYFLEVIAAYPIGLHVFLNNLESGLVIKNNPGFTLRPTIRILYTGEDLAPHPSPYELDLSQSLDLIITRVIE